ncbi:MAG: type II toxin-antitoxin system prevent-host-death family antitoxin [Enterobacterales bacterium]|uniref:type II toxin-antitoxin system Phd/YefM family antitoxin n=1 Tax=Obesumbacterium proteus TaxID=82983 RepID=UPI00242DEB1D|nr:type II toxin-antitoxin system prevent-host-death family antitoxin [Obesumbacterium proteus]MDN5451112.1 type II toxin-antitoxin system prevent-host-death family antitoxin [Enterobacterales bacterium]MDN6088855.1 type II toxin-antitoxin system prevent-host-death family antitoxin [Enterobacterales bacterium]
MKTFTANQAKTQFGELLMSVQAEPIQISKNGKTVAVVMSYENYLAVEDIKAAHLQHCFEQAQSDIVNGQTIDGEAFMQDLVAGKHDKK